MLVLLYEVNVFQFITSWKKPCYNHALFSFLVVTAYDMTISIIDIIFLRRNKPIKIDNVQYDKPEARGRGFETYLRCVVFLSKTL